MRKQRGVTVTEIMVTLLIVSIVIKFVVYPNILAMMATANVKSAANELGIGLSTIRSEAMKARNNRRITAAAGGWSKGWVVTNPTTGETVSEFHNIPPTTTIGAWPVTTSYLVSGLTGAVTKVDGVTPLDIQFSICDTAASTETGYYVYLNRFGRVLVQRHYSTLVCN